MAYNPIRCYLCNVLRCGSANCTEKDPVFNQINGQVRQSSSQRIIKLGAKNVGLHNYCVKCSSLLWNQSSDRYLSSGRGVQMSLKRGRPGGGVTQPINGGVDIKHNSYDRRIRKLQAKVLSN